VSVPEPWEAIILALATYRVYRLLAEDTILDRPRAWLIKRMPAKFTVGLTCPWCAPPYILAGWFGLWQWEPRWTLVFASFAAILTAVGMMAKLDE
jgi:hypothetical protein